MFQKISMSVGAKLNKDFVFHCRWVCRKGYKTVLIVFVLQYVNLYTTSNLTFILFTFLKISKSLISSIHYRNITLLSVKVIVPRNCSSKGVSNSSVYDDYDGLMTKTSTKTIQTSLLKYVNRVTYVTV